MDWRKRVLGKEKPEGYQSGWVWEEITCRDVHSVSLINMLILKFAKGSLDYLDQIICSGRPQTADTPNCKGTQELFLVIWIVGRTERRIVKRRWRLREALETNLE